MRLRVSDVAQAQGGLVLGRKEAPAHTVNPFSYKRLNLRALEKNGFINFAELEMFYAREPLENALFTQRKDIVIRLFSPLHPVLIDDQSQGLLVPSQLAVLKVTNVQAIMPEYLRLCLAQDELQEHIQKLESGTAQRTVKLSTVMEAEIEVPDMEIQRKVVNLDFTARTREHMYLSLIEQERLLTESIIRKILGGQLP